MFITVPDEQASFVVWCPRHERAELIAAEPEKFWVPAHEAASSSVRVRLATLEGLGELRDILEDSWRQAATGQLLEAHPELGPSRHSVSA